MRQANKHDLFLLMTFDQMMMQNDKEYGQHTSLQFAFLISISAPNTFDKD